MNQEQQTVGIEEFLAGLQPGRTVDTYTDGACSGNPGPGGWAGVFISCGKVSSISGFEKATTNNRMELIAAIESIRILPSDTEVVVHTDSTYVKNGITEWIKVWSQNNWQSKSKQPVKNQDLWRILASLVEGRQIKWLWVKGHSTCSYNQYADALARNAIVASYIEG
ncbi:MAG: ribonuclease HI [Holosporales bacterium]|jgi:ribonuclease HI|nr:ribonuclease HI [Holosporales bacterium]